MNEVRSYYHIFAVVIFAVLSFSLTNTYTSGDYTAANTTGELEAGTAGEADFNIRLNIVIPESDTTITTQNRQRIAANTEPGSRVFINEKEATVYPTGGFAGLIDVPVGRSISVIRVVNPDGKSLTRELHFQRPEEIATAPASPLIIKQDMMKPDQTLEAGKDDIIEVQFRGSTGQIAYFRINGVTENIPMQELQRSQTGGIGGVYAGQYTVREGDFAPDTDITYTLRNDEHIKVTATNNTSVSIIPDNFPRTAQIRGRLPHINAQSDIDRLGGSRLGFLEAGVLVEVTGRIGDLYRIRLTDELEGYLPVRFAELLPMQTPQPHSYTGSITASGGDHFDIVTITLGQRLPYTSSMRTYPDNTIEVDIYGAESKTSWIRHHTSADGIKNISWKQVAPGHFRLVIQIKHEIHWGYHTGYGVGSSLQIQIQRPPTIFSLERPLEGVPIAIDPGHGGSNRGALGSTGKEEKEIVLNISRLVYDKLIREGAQVIMTRDRDINVSMAERSEMIIASNASVLVSIHANSIGPAVNPLAIHGTSSYYRFDAFRPFAGIIHSRMLELPLRNFGLTGNFNFTLNALTELPNVLVETGFISHPEEEMKLLDPEFQEKVAEKIIEGLREFFLQYGHMADYSS